MPELSHTIAYRAVAGAVINALHGHPDWSIPKNFARSVAKRAAGTLMAHAGPSLLPSAWRSGQRQKVTIRTSVSGGGSPQSMSLLSRAHDKLTAQAAIAHKAGNHDAFLEYVTAARAVKRVLQRQAGKPHA